MTYVPLDPSYLYPSYKNMRCQGLFSADVTIDLICIPVTDNFGTNGWNAVVILPFKALKYIIIVLTD